MSSQCLPAEVFLNQSFCHSDLMGLEELHLAEKRLEARSVVGWSRPGFA